MDEIRDLIHELRCDIANARVAGENGCEIDDALLTLSKLQDKVFGMTTNISNEDANEKIEYWAQEISSRKLSSTEIAINVRWLIDKLNEQTKNVSIENCMDCSKHSVLRDPDPHDWFCDDDEKVICTEANCPITVSCRPYNKRKECTTPDWCPLKK